MLSIVIPTHRRADILQKTLKHLEAQTAKDQIEVVVVSDGPDAKAKNVADPDMWTMPVRYFSIPKSHQGVARNKGMMEAQGEYVLCIGDDIFPGPNACQIHLQAHQSNIQKPQAHTAVLGFTTWDPALQINSVMLWLERSGWQFGYPQLEPYRHAFVPKEMQHRFTYTSHISLPTHIAREHPFREDVALYGWEDIEWGMRLRDAGVQLFYEPDAHAHHHHHLTLEASLKRMETVGESAVRMDTLAPGLHLVPHGWKRFAYQMLALLPTMRGEHAKAFLQGVTRAERP